MGIVEFRDKGFVLDLKLLFTIVNYFSRRFPSKFSTVKLVCFIGFLRLSYLVLFNFLLHYFDMILMFVNSKLIWLILNPLLDLMFVTVVVFLDTFVLIALSCILKSKCINGHKFPLKDLHLFLESY